jgi:ABC-type transporter Mla MlaB component
LGAAGEELPGRSRVLVRGAVADVRVFGAIINESGRRCQGLYADLPAAIVVRSSAELAAAPMSFGRRVRLSERMTNDILLIVDAETDEVLGHVDARTPDLALVEALARVQLRARRRGSRIRLTNVSERLRGLLDLVGLADVLCIEARRQPELGEQLRVDEVVQPGDTPL